MQYMFTWSVRYFGFIQNNRLFTRDSHYVGWIEDNGSVWLADGEYAGEVVDENYILRQTSRTKPVSRVPRVTPVSPVGPVPPVDRVGRIDRIGYVDALE